MRIIQVHNYYQLAGGEDSVVAAERTLLETAGHVVIPYYRHNETLGAGLWAMGKASLQTLWNRKTYREFRRLLKQERPDVVHCHNTFPLISPAIYWACAREGIPVVQTLHNYRMLCLNALLFRSVKKKNGAGGGHDGICEKCLRKSFKWPGIRYGCYRDSAAGSLIVAVMFFIHKLIGTWIKKVTVYIALTEFQKQKMIEGGFPANKIRVKPNFIRKSDAGCRNSDANMLPADARSLISERTHFALFVGRLSSEKGCDVLIQAWNLFAQKWTAEMPLLLIAGDGPERDSLEHQVADLRRLNSVRFLGKQSTECTRLLMRHAQVLVFPSVWYETFGLTVAEAGLQGTPSVISDCSVAASFIENGSTGLRFKADGVRDLAEKFEWIFTHPDEMRMMGERARCVFKERYSEEKACAGLIEIYNAACLNGK